MYGVSKQCEQVSKNVPCYHCVRRCHDVSSAIPSFRVNAGVVPEELVRHSDEGAAAEETEALLQHTSTTRRMQH